jgi:hypothetical protein
MKLRGLLVAALAPMLLFTGCDNIFGLDNYDEPNAMLTGRLLYQGNPVNVRTGGIEMELWQPGFELNTKINVYVNQEGSYSASIFNGSYKLIPIAGQGPWLVTTDTLNVTVSGETTADFSVTPYFVPNNPQFSFIAANGTPASPEGRVQVTLNVGTVVSPIQTARQVEWVGLYVATTAFLDRTNRAVQVEQLRAALPATYLTAPITLGINLPAGIRVTPSPAPRTHVYVRAGIKVTGIGEMIFTPITKLAI